MRYGWMAIHSFIWDGSIYESRSTPFVRVSQFHARSPSHHPQDPPSARQPVCTMERESTDLFEDDFGVGQVAVLTRHAELAANG